MKEDIYCAYNGDIVTCDIINCKACEHYKAFLLKCTCTNCPENKSCLYAFDAYNTNGDCLAEKQGETK